METRLVLLIKSSTQEGYLDRFENPRLVNDISQAKIFSSEEAKLYLQRNFARDIGFRASGFMNGLSFPTYTMIDLDTQRVVVSAQIT